MRHLVTVGAAVAGLLLGSAMSRGQEAGGWVGQRVITRPGTVLKIGRKVVEDHQPEVGSRAGQRQLVRVYRVDRASGPWLWLVAGQENIRGWVRAAQVVPCDRALDELTRAIRAHPNDAGAFVNRGILWHEQEEYDKAIADYNEAIRLDPVHAVASFNRGRSWKAKGDFDKAIADFTEAIRRDPTYARPYNDRGLEWEERGRHDQAIADHNEAIRLDPTYAMAYVNRGTVWFAKGDHDQAIADYGEAIRLDPRSAQAYKNRAGFWYLKGEYDKALADCNEALRLDPKDVTAFNNRAHIWAAKGGFAKAIADCNEALRLDPRRAGAYVLRAWIWATCSDANYRDGKRAVASATRGCELTNWKDADSLQTLAAACAEAGDFDAAVKWQENCSESAKEGPDKMLATARLWRYRAKQPYHEEPAALATDKVAGGADISVEQLEAALEAPPKVDQALSLSSIQVQGAPARPQATGRTVAHVGAAVLTVDELKEAVQAQLAKLPAGSRPNHEEIKTLTRQVLDMLVERSTIVQAAKRELKNPAHLQFMMEVADTAWRTDELPPLLREMEVANESELQAKLAARGRSLAALRESYRLEFLARGYLVQKLKPRITPSDSELRDYYNAHLDDFHRDAGPAPFAEIQDEIRRIVFHEKVERESKAFLETIRRETVVTTIYDEKVGAEPEP